MYLPTVNWSLVSISSPSSVLCNIPVYLVLIWLMTIFSICDDLVYDNITVVM
jgi:hypothetical protein